LEGQAAVHPGLIKYGSILDPNFKHLSCIPKDSHYQTHGMREVGQGISSHPLHLKMELSWLFIDKLNNGGSPNKQLSFLSTKHGQSATLKDRCYDSQSLYRSYTGITVLTILQ
jgi:hypothetical protein